ncbi:3'-5' exoribonuclease 1-like [Glandiceps talaboti]
MARPRFYLCIDLEATCFGRYHMFSSQPAPAGFQPEIIEIGAIILDSRTLQQKGEFQSVCRPVKHPVLSKYCLDLTEISQETVDKADTFPIVWGRFIDWMVSMGLSPTSQPTNFKLVTDGPFDCGRFIYTQFIISKLTYPSFASEFVELKTEYKSLKGQRRSRHWPNLAEMYDGLGLAQPKIEHRALSDAKCIAEVFRTLLQRRPRRAPPTMTMEPHIATR